MMYDCVETKNSFFCKGCGQTIRSKIYPTCGTIKNNNKEAKNE